MITPGGWYIDTEIVYPNIVDYMIQKGWSISRFAEECDLNITTLSKALRDKHKSNSTMSTPYGPTKRVIDAILKVTKMEYEKAFWKPED